MLFVVFGCIAYHRTYIAKVESKYCVSVRLCVEFLFCIVSERARARRKKKIESNNCGEERKYIKAFSSIRRRDGIDVTF